MWERLSDVSGDNAHCGPDFRAYHGSPARPPPTAPAGGGAITMDHLQSVRSPPPRPLRRARVSTRSRADALAAAGCAASALRERG